MWVGFAGLELQEGHRKCKNSAIGSCQGHAMIWMVALLLYRDKVRSIGSLTIPYH